MKMNWVYLIQVMIIVIIFKEISKKKIKRKRCVLVKYQGWPDKFNDRLPQENVLDWTLLEMLSMTLLL